ncbi:interleukin-23 receptor-like [Varanus komodoensis]|uniref:interleukin-23 receptor-like n=1 Tax=Varanus komodoensis TaxID=61221 RepID=UPI001CF798D9|nr:interleukin-23 receptor-like [Varanus komodoensis]
MIAPNVLVVLFMFFYKIYPVILSHHCSAAAPGPILCYGHVWTEPANINQIGQDISINCHSDKEFCENAKIYMDLNEVRVEDSNLTVINKTTVQLQLHNYGEPFSKVVCNVQCSKTRVVICGTQFCMGYLPDRPANLACVIQEYSDCMICTWDPGKDTYLNTSYNLYLKSVQTKENKTFNANSALNGVNIPLNQLQKNQTFSVSVCAKNALGAAHSDQLLVELHNIVIPALPVITQNKTIDSPIRKTIMQWEEQSASNETSCEERYKEMASEKWHVREWDASIQRMHRTEYNLNANTMYEFQVRCKFTHVGSIWSKWSESVVYKTPEAEPSSILDVWRYLGPTYQNGSQEVTILIKPFLPHESRGRILGYRIFYECQGEMIDLCQTTETKCKVLVPPAVTIVYVTAHNSKGSSSPANITMNQQPQHYHDSLPPTNMQIIEDEHKGISATWEPPKSIGKSVLWYIVEWTPADFSHNIHGIMWEKVPVQNTTTYVKEDLQVERDFNISVYAVYQDSTSEPCTLQKLVKKNEARQTENISTATNGDVDTDVGVLLGISFGVACFSVFTLALAAKKACRKRVKAVFSSVKPAWLFEDYPKLQNSNVIRSLQGKNSSAAHDAAPLFADYADAVVTEVEEIMVHKQHKTLDDEKETREDISLKVNFPEDTAVGNSDMPEENGYKPQVFNKTFQGSVFNGGLDIHSQNPGVKSTLPMNSFVRDYTNPMIALCPVAGTDENMFLVEKISLVLNNSRNEQNNMVSSAVEESDTPMANQWKSLLSGEDIQEQTLIPDEMLSGLKAVNYGGSPNVMGYFTQNTAK